MKLKSITLLFLLPALMVLVNCGGGSEPVPTAIPTAIPLPTATPLPKVFSTDQAESILLDINDFPDGWSIKRQGLTVSGTLTEFLTAKKLILKIRAHRDDNAAQAAFSDRKTEAKAIIDRRTISGDQLEDVENTSMFVWMPSGNPNYQTEKWGVTGIYRNVTFSVFHEGSIGAAKKDFALSIARKQMDRIKDETPMATIGPESYGCDTSSLIIYQSTRPNIPTDIFKMECDGSNKVNLTQQAKFREKKTVVYGGNRDPMEKEPVWSPDRTKFLAQSSGGLYYTDSPENTDKGEQRTTLVILDVDFSTTTEAEDISLEDMIMRRVANGIQADWSPDGTKIVFIGESRKMYTVDIDGTNLTQITIDSSDKDKWDQIGEPDWSPDGEKIAFNASIPPLSGNNGGGIIYVMDKDGSNVTRITEFSIDDYLTGLELTLAKDKMVNSPNPVPTEDVSSYPRWSPDGTKIAFHLQRAIDHTDLHKVIDIDVKSGIHIMDSDGSNVTFLTEGTEPTWSPDGTMIAFRHWLHGSHDIYKIDLDGTNRLNLTNDDAEDRSPDWSSEPE